MMVLLTLLAAVSVAITLQREMFGVIVLAGVYSFLMASVMVVFDAVDVAMTEASVGAGISTVLGLAALHLTKSIEYPQVRNIGVPLFVAAAVAVALVWGTFSLPPFGVADAPIHLHTAPRFIADSQAHLMPPNIVTAVLADFRGFDTLGETTVILTAGIGVLLLLKGKRRKLDGSKDGDNPDGRQA